MGTTAFRRRVSPEDYRVLQELASAQTPDAARARIVLAVLGGASPAALARQAGVPRTTVYSWVRRFAATGAAGLCHRSPHGYPIGPSRAGTVAEIACPEAGTVKLSLLDTVGGPKVGNDRRIGSQIRLLRALATARTGSMWGGFVQSKLNVTVPSGTLPLVQRVTRYGGGRLEAAHVTPPGQGLWRWRSGGASHSGLSIGSSLLLAVHLRFCSSLQRLTISSEGCGHNPYCYSFSCSW